MGIFNRKKKNCNDGVGSHELNDIMQNAMRTQGNSMVNQTELSIAYQAYTMFRYHDGLDKNTSVKNAGRLVVELQDAISKAKCKYPDYDEN